MDNATGESDGLPVKPFTDEQEQDPTTPLPKRAGCSPS
jgi:hypothetical protein